MNPKGVLLQVFFFFFFLLPSTLFKKPTAALGEAPAHESSSLPAPARPRSGCRGFELDADENPQTGISLQMGLNQPITALGGPLREDGGAGGGAATRGPRPGQGGGAATGPAPNGAAGEEVSVCEPAAARAPGLAGRDLAAPGSQVAGRRQRFGLHTLPSACTLCPEEERGTRGVEGEGDVAAPPSGERRPRQCPARPRALNMHTQVFCVVPLLTQGCRHKTQTHRNTPTPTRTHCSLPVCR